MRTAVAASITTGRRSTHCLWICFSTPARARRRAVLVAPRPAAFLEGDVEPGSADAALHLTGVSRMRRLALPAAALTPRPGRRSVPPIRAHPPSGRPPPIRRQWRPNAATCVSWPRACRGTPCLDPPIPAERRTSIAHRRSEVRAREPGRFGQGSRDRRRSTPHQRAPSRRRHPVGETRQVRSLCRCASHGSNPSGPFVPFPAPWAGAVQRLPPFPPGPDTAGTRVAGPEWTR